MLEQEAPCTGEGGNEGEVGFGEYAGTRRTCVVIFQSTIKSGTEPIKKIVHVDIFNNLVRLEEILEGRG